MHTIFISSTLLLSTTKINHPMQSNLLPKPVFPWANETTMAGARPSFYRRIAIVSQASDATKRTVTPMKAPGKKTKQRLITISTGDGRWQGKWNCDFTFSFRKLQLLDLLDDVKDDSDISVSLCVENQAGLGLSVEGSIRTCFNTKCYNCCSPFLREINSTFMVWILPSPRRVKGDPSKQLPEIGGDDPSVIYVKPGFEADLDSVVRDTLRLATSVQETCSESCEKPEPKFQQLGTLNKASAGVRWHKLLELKKQLIYSDTQKNM